MKKEQILSLTVIVLVCIVAVLLVDTFRAPELSESSSLTPNWNYSSAAGPNTYQWLASSFVFVIKRPADVTSWEYGDEEYALHIIQRGTGEIVCPAFSGLSIAGSDIDLDPFVGNAVLVTSFTSPDEEAGSIYIERLELDTAVNERIDEYRSACPFPFERMDQAMGILSNL